MKMTYGSLCMRRTKSFNLTLNTTLAYEITKMNTVMTYEIVSDKYKLKINKQMVSLLKLFVSHVFFIRIS